MLIGGDCCSASGEDFHDHFKALRQARRSKIQQKRCHLELGGLSNVHICSKCLAVPCESEYGSCVESFKTACLTSRGSRRIKKFAANTDIMRAFKPTPRLPTTPGDRYRVALHIDADSVAMKNVKRTSRDLLREHIKAIYSPLIRIETFRNAKGDSGLYKPREIASSYSLFSCVMAAAYGPSFWP